jgi:Tol biopolymer transport system component
VTWHDASDVLSIGGPTWRPRLELLDLASNTSLPLTHDFAIFDKLSVTADGRAGAITRFERRAGIWTAEATGARLMLRIPGSMAGAEQPFIDNEGGLTYIAANRDGWFSLYHLPPGSSTPVAIATRVMYVENSEGGPMPKPAVTPDGRTVVFTEMSASHALNKVNSDGSNLVKLVDENAASPAIMGDGQHVLFTPSEGPGLFVVPLAGGAPRRLYDGPVVAPLAVPPDGGRVLFRSGRPGEAIVCDLPDCGNRKALNVASVVWAPDGQGVVYIDPSDTRRLLEMPLAGGTPRELVRITDDGDPIAGFAWSPNGKLLALSRGRWTTDVVVVKGLK